MLERRKGSSGSRGSRPAPERGLGRALGHVSSNAFSFYFVSGTGVGFPRKKKCLKKEKAIPEVGEGAWREEI